MVFAFLSKVCLLEVRDLGGNLPTSYEAWT
jgi:hypothetical protein